jgi:hypothetical protein
MYVLLIQSTLHAGLLLIFFVVVRPVVSRIGNKSTTKCTKRRCYLVNLHFYPALKVPPLSIYVRLNTLLLYASISNGYFRQILQ